MKAKKALLSALCLTLAFSALASCGGKGTGNNNTSSSTTSSSSSDSSSVNSVSKWKPVDLEDNDESLSDYEIVVAAEAGASYQYAAQILQKYVKKATDVEIPIVTDAMPEGENEILIGETNRSEDDEIDFETLGDESFVVKSVGKDLVIGGNKRGCIYGVYEYLEALGFRFYAADVEKIPAKGDVFVASDADLSWEPVFTVRQHSFYGSNDRYPVSEAATEYAVSRWINSNYVRASLKTDEKYGGSVGYIGGDSYAIHTVRKFMPYASLAMDHPLWFSNINGEVQVDNNNGGNGYETDICWTNEEGMAYLYQQMLNTIDHDADNKRISLSMSDTHKYCKCATCSAEQEEYGVSGWYYRAINRIAKKLQVDRPGIELDTLCYTYAQNAPDFEMEDNVVIRLCLTMCRWHTDPEECHALVAEGEKSLKTEQARMTQWQGKAKQFQIYSYPEHWAANLTTDPGYEAMRNNVRFFAEQGATGIEAEGFIYYNLEFNDLKAYLQSELLRNPYISEEEYQYHMNDFLEGYYGDGWKSIRAYLDRTNEIILDMMADSKTHLKHWYYYEENLPFKDWYDGTSYDMTVIDELNGYWDAAEEAANPQQNERIRRSRTHWTYLEFYNTWDVRYANASEEEKAELVRRNEELYNEFKEFGIKRRRADGPDIKYINDFTKSVTTWWSGVF